MDISEIKQIVKLMEAKGLTEFSFKDDNREFCLKRGNGDHPVVISHPAVPPPTIIPSTEPTVNEPKESKNDDNDGLRTCTFVIQNDAGEYVDGKVNDFVAYGYDPASTSGTVPTVVGYGG